MYAGTATSHLESTSMTSHLESEMPLNRVVLLEDVDADRLTVRLHLELMGFVVYDTPSPLEAKEIFSQRDYSLVILHLTYEPLRSLELCRWIRASSTVPIIMLTNREEAIDESMVIAAGADDYVTKPIESKILTSRITQQINRGQSQRAPRANILAWGALEMDLSQHSFLVEGKEVNLTNIEFQFMQLLLENPQRIFSRQQVIEAIGILKGVGSSHVVDTHASRIRTKIKKNGGPEVINVVRSVGYRLASVATHKSEKTKRSVANS